MTRDELQAQLAELGYADCVIKPEDFGEEGYFDVYVARSRFEAAKRDILIIGANIRQLTPPLVPANTGDWVRIYSDFEGSDDRSPIGLVTSRRTEDGETFYGCSYLQSSLGNRYLTDVYSFHLSAENYGGYHGGFLAVLTPAQVQAALEVEIDRAADCALRSIQERRERDKAQIPELLAHVATGKCAEATLWHPPAEPTSVSVQIQIPTIHVKKRGDHG